MYLSQLILNPRSRQVRNELMQPYQMHRTLMQAFPDGLQRRTADADADERVLFRLDQHPESGLWQVLVQSQLPPDWAQLRADYALRIEGPKVFAPILNVGQRLNFRLRANPSIKRQGKRLGLHSENEQLAWLQRKATTAGFTLLAVQISKDQVVKDDIHRDDGLSHHLNVLSVQFDGTLDVLVPDLFVQTLMSGIGSAKAFGCGLLSLAKY